MPHPLILGVIAGCSVAVSMVGMSRSRAKTEAWRKVGLDLGLELHSSGSLVGQIGHVTVEIIRHGRYTEINTRHVRALPISVRREMYPNSPVDVQVGDDADDRALYLEGREDEILAVLDRETRTAILSLISAGQHIETGTVRTKVLNDQPLGPQVRSMVALAARLSPSTTIADGLAHRVQDATEEPGVRARALEVLSQQHGRRASELAGQLIGAADTPDRLLMSVLALDLSLTRELFETHLDDLVQHPSLRHHTVNAATRIGLRVPPGVLQLMLMSHRDVEISAAAEHIAATDAAPFTALLVRTLHTTKGGVQRTVIAALRETADRRAITALKTLVGVFKVAVNQSAAKEAIAHLEEGFRLNSVFTPPTKADPQ